MLSLLLPSRPKQPLTLPLIEKIPPANGRKRPNGTLIVEDADAPEALYKFTPWARSQLAWNEIEICARLQQLDVSVGMVPLQGVGATQEYLVRKMQRSAYGALPAFLFNACKGDAALMPLELVLSLLAQIAQTMAQLHALDMIHRDLKAENILVFGDDPKVTDWTSVQAKISDFDRALELPPGQCVDTPVGSLLHMAPELLTWAPYDCKVDVYAFGIVMFEIAHGGRVAYDNVSTGMPGALTAMEFSEKVVNAGLRPEWSYDDPLLKQLAADCWDQNPHKRPQFTEIVERILRHPEDIKIPVFPAPEVAPACAIHARQEIGFASDIGCQRCTMEDALCLLETANTLFVGVFDGLRDARSSAWAARQLLLHLAAELSVADMDINTAITQAFAQVNRCLRALEPAIESGTTATIAVLRAHDLCLAWLGDSPAWLVRRDDKAGHRVLELIKPHHPQRADESARLAACGARIARQMRWLDNGEQMPTGPARVVFPADAPTGVALSRALGLFSLHPAISEQVETIQIAREEDDLFLVMGTDGVFDFLDHAQVVERVTTSATAAQAADALIAEVLQRGAPDNAGVVVVDMKCAL